MGKNKEPISNLMVSLAKEGYQDVLLLEKEQAKEVLTDRRCEVIDTIRDGEIGSIRALAEELDRKVPNVHRDLQLLAEHGVIEFEEDGRKKIPKIKHNNIFIYPLVLGEKEDES